MGSTKTYLNFLTLQGSVQKRLTVDALLRLPRYPTGALPTAGVLPGDLVVEQGTDTLWLRNTNNTAWVQVSGGPPPPPFYPADRVVAADGTGTDTTVQAAINALPPGGGSIYVKPGVYNESITIDKNNVLIFGAGPYHSRIRAPAATRAVNIASDRRNIMLVGLGLEATGTTQEVLRAAVTSLGHTITGLRFYNCRFLGYTTLVTLNLNPSSSTFGLNPYDAWFENCIFENANGNSNAIAPVLGINGAQAVNVGGTGAGHIQVRNSFFMNTAAHVHTAGSVLDVIGCTFVSGYTAASKMSLVGALGMGVNSPLAEIIRVLGCSFYFFPSPGAGSLLGAVGLTQAFGIILIEGCYFIAYNDAANVALGRGKGIVMGPVTAPGAGSQHYMVRGCYFRGLEYGIDLFKPATGNAVYPGTIQGNVFHDCLTAIRVSPNGNTVECLQILDNVFVRDSAASMTAVNFERAIGQAMIEGNTFSRVTTSFTGINVSRNLIRRNFFYPGDIGGLPGDAGWSEIFAGEGIGRAHRFYTTWQSLDGVTTVGTAPIISGGVATVSLSRAAAGSGGFHTGLTNPYITNRRPRMRAQFRVNATGADIRLFIGLRESPGTTIPGSGERYLGLKFNGTNWIFEVNDGGTTPSSTTLTALAAGAWHSVEMTLDPDVGINPTIVVDGGSQQKAISSSKRPGTTTPLAFQMVALLAGTGTGTFTFDIGEVEVVENLS